MNETLCVLDLSWNGIADDGAHILSGVLLYNNTLHELDVSSNRISQEGCFCFAQALLKNNALRILKVSTLYPIEMPGLISMEQRFNSVSS